MDYLKIILFFVVLIAFCYFIGKFGGKRTIQIAKKDVLKLDDTKLLLKYKRTNPVNMLFLIIFGIPGIIMLIVMWSSVKEAKNIYFEEVQKRNLTI